MAANQEVIYYCNFMVPLHIPERSLSNNKWIMDTVDSSNVAGNRTAQEQVSKVATNVESLKGIYIPSGGFNHDGFDFVSNEPQERFFG